MTSSQIFLKTIILHTVELDVPRNVADERLEELRNLIQTVGGIVIKKIIQRRGRPSAKTFLGSGKIEEAAQFAREQNIDLVIINGILKPNQYLHLQNMFPGKMLWDRTDLILNIFDKHASSNLSQLQIKLARLHHEIPKIYSRNATTLFERAGAGIGTRGPGEKGIEDEKRHIRRQIKSLEEKIKILHRTYMGQRQNRERTGLPTAALVGYTNAGKSSLMTLLTRKPGVVASSALFTTLDTKIGKAFLGISGKALLVADTIGFISDLPPTLISSFLTTLQEAREADLLLHVIDASDTDFQKKIEVVEDILKQIGCDTIPRMYIFNKIDQCASTNLDPILNQYSEYSPVALSCSTEEGLEKLKQILSEFLSTLPFLFQKDMLLMKP